MMLANPKMEMMTKHSRDKRYLILNDVLDRLLYLVNLTP
jgi:hypothetical protein